MRLVVAIVLALGCARAAPALAQGPSAGAFDVAGTISRAQTAFDSGDFAGAASLALELARSPADISPDDRAEAWRIAALASFYAQDSDGAREAFREYLRLKPRATLDPNIYAAEVRELFDEVQHEMKGELIELQPPAESPGNPWLSVVPVFGQFQNDEPTKGWIVVGAGTALLATNVATYLVLEDWCDGDSTCGDRGNRARAVKGVNITSGLLAIGVCVYAAVDGFVGYRRREREMAVEVVATPGGAEVGWTWRF